MNRVIVEHLSKQFLIGCSPENEGALAKFLTLVSGRENKRVLWALKDVSFQARAGEIVGIIGKNGSGKSTLLRVLAGIFTHNEGKVLVYGKIIPLIYLTAGLQRRLSVRDNIFLACSIFGLGRKTIQTRLPAIIQFAELEDYVDTKLYQLSIGTVERLAFSLAFHSEPEVLLLDELFEVGDEGFRSKVVRKIESIVSEGATVILVNHALDVVQKHCDRVIWMVKGQIHKEGSPKDLIAEYQETERKGPTANG